MSGTTFNTGVPIYLQIMQRIRLDIISGKMAPGQRVPAVRDLAMAFGVNPNTMQRALSELEREALLYSERTSGRFITRDTEHIEQQRRLLSAEETRRYRESMESLGLHGEQIMQALEKSFKEDEGS